MDTVPEDQEEDTANASSSSNAAGLVVPSFDLAKMPVGGQGRGYERIVYMANRELCILQNYNPISFLYFYYSFSK